MEREASQIAVVGRSYSDTVRTSPGREHQIETPGGASFLRQAIDILMDCNVTQVAPLEGGRATEFELETIGNRVAVTQFRLSEPKAARNVESVEQVAATRVVLHADEYMRNFALKFRPDQQIVVHLNGELPRVAPDVLHDPDPHDWAPRPRPFRDPLWHNLAANNRIQRAANLLADVNGKNAERAGETSIVVSLSTLRRAGAAITRGLSVESTVEDLFDELHRHPALKALAQFSHIYVISSLAGLIHIDNTAELSRAWVHFDALYNERIRSSWKGYGCVLGRSSALVAAILSQPMGTSPGSIKKRISRLEDALRLSRAVQSRGYKKGDTSLLDVFGDFRGVFSSREARTSAIPRDDNAYRYVHTEVPRYVFGEPGPAQLQVETRWRILDSELQDAPVHRINVAMAIAQFGHEKVLNRPWTFDGLDEKERKAWAAITVAEYWNPLDRAPDFVTLEDSVQPSLPDFHGARRCPIPILGDVLTPFWVVAPIVSFGRLTAIEREEVEQLRSIRNAMAKHDEDVRSWWQGCNSSKEALEPKIKPLSIAVFGPPGSGKSFAFKEIAEKLGIIKDHIWTVNVSQLASPHELGARMKKIVDKGRDLAADHDRKISPTQLVFFDEFDSAAGSIPLGWLKNFLEPMQDGIFSINDETLVLPPSIFVFAGGVYPTFEGFDPRIDPPKEDAGYELSAAQKSRIEKFKEQKGPDFISRLRGHMNVVSMNSETGDLKHYIRRAIQLHSILSRHGTPLVHPAVLYAMLTVDKYRHGVRSMEAVVNMCIRVNDRIQVASLPALEQLNMHVDAKEFFIRVFRGRERHTGFAEDWDSLLDTRIEEARRIANEAGKTADRLTATRKADPKTS